MNYQRIYDDIISFAVSQERSKDDGYFENHHIIPRSLGGSNVRENLVLLTAREHFICHYLLVKIHRDNTSNYTKMLHAFMLMKGMRSYQHRYINARLYESMKEEYGKIRSDAFKDKPLSDDQKMRISNSLKQSYSDGTRQPMSEEGRKSVSEKAKKRKRKPFSDEYKAKMSAIMKERHRWKDKEN